MNSSSPVAPNVAQTIASNKELSRRWFEEVWNRKRVEAIRELAAPDGVIHGVADGGKVLRGRDTFVPFFERFVDAFPDIRITVDEVIGEGDLTAVRFTCEGTHRGAGLDLAPTGKAVRFTAMCFMRWSGGRIVEGWNEFDAMGMLQQVSALVEGPTAATSAAKVRI